MRGFIGCGAQYDPIFWEPETRLEHVRLMQEAGLSFVRLFEFCWSAFEPEEGRYEFEWADDFVEILVAHETVILNTTEKLDGGERREGGALEGPSTAMLP